MHYPSRINRLDWGGTLTGATSGGQLGSSIGTMFGPIGKLVGGGLGAIIGGITGNRSSEKRIAAQKAEELAIKKAKDKAKAESDRMAAKEEYNNDQMVLNSLSLSNNDLFMKKGGFLSANIPSKNTKRLGLGSKILTNDSGSTSGSHETGQNIPIKKGKETIAIAEPGEVIVFRPDITPAPMVLSKRSGHAQAYTNLERIKNPLNASIIEQRQKKVVQDNISLVGEDNLYANDGKFLAALKKVGTKIGSRAFDLADGAGMDTLFSNAGTIANLISTNTTLKDQERLIRENVEDAQSFTPRLNKMYNQQEDYDISDMTSSINQGYASVTAGLDASGMDSGTISALKNNANLSRLSSMAGVIGERNRFVNSIKSNNLSNLMSNNAANNQTINASNEMKLSARMQGRDLLGSARAARLGNVQGALGELNTIRSDKMALESMMSRWKDTVGDDMLPNGMRRAKKPKWYVERKG